MAGGGHRRQRGDRGGRGARLRAGPHAAGARAQPRRARKHLDALKILVDHNGKMKKKEMAELAEKERLITINANPNNHSQARFASLDKNIIAPLEFDWGYIVTEKVGRNRWIHLTDEGRWASEFLI